MTPDAPDELLRVVTTSLDGLAIPHMVVGSFASTFLGEPRTTRDLDLVIDPTPAQLEHWVESLDPDRFYVDADVARDALRRRSMFNVIEMATGWKLDLVIRKARAFSQEELQRRQKVEMLGVKVDAATAEDTIIAKLEWAKQGGSERQLEDAAGILRVRAGSLDLGYIERWVAELDLADQWQRTKGSHGDTSG
jgi:hypothetical protein